MLWTIWYHSYDLKNVKNAHAGIILLVKLQTSACNFTTSITPPWVFFTFFKILKMVANRTKRQYDCVSSFA